MPLITAYYNRECNEYYVKVGKHWYEMNAHADIPNGVCIYMGVGERADQRSILDDRWELATELPIGVVRQIVNLIARETGWNQAFRGQ